MNAVEVKCIKCLKSFPIDVLYHCPECGGILDVQYDYNKVSYFSNKTKCKKMYTVEGDLQLMNSNTEKKIFHNSGLWKYREVLPLDNLENLVSLGEGDTPLILASNFGNLYNIEKFFIKDETRQPTGSFKDRPTSVAVSKAKEFGMGTIVVSSSGNAGASAAAYAARAGMRCIVFAPSKVPAEKLLQIRAYGAKVILVDGDYSKAFHFAHQIASERKWLNVTSTYLSPYPTEGNKTVAYEIWEQMGDNLPDWILIPIGAGPLLTGIFKGFSELTKLGLISKFPKLVCVQAEGCAPIVRSFNENKHSVRSWGKPETCASGIADQLQGYEQDGSYTLENVYKSKGVALSVTDLDILKAANEIAQREGIFAEPTGAVPLAGAIKLRERAIISSTDTIVCLVTGVGFKDLSVYNTELKEPPHNASDLADVNKIIDSF